MGRLASVTLEAIRCHRPGMFIGEPLETPLRLAPPATCEQCGCRLSRYRDIGESRCAPCLGPAQHDATFSPQHAHRPSGTVAPLVLAALADAPLGCAAIAQATGLRRSSVKFALGRLIAEGQVVVEGRRTRPTYRLR